MVVRCTRCGSTRVSRNHNNANFKYECDMCKHQFTISNSGTFGMAVALENEIMRMKRIEREEKANKISTEIYTLKKEIKKLKRLERDEREILENLRKERLEKESEDILGKERLHTEKLERLKRERKELQSEIIELMK